MEKLEISKLQDKKSVVIAYIESKGYKNVSILEKPEDGWARDISFSNDNDRIVLCFKDNEPKPVGLTFKLDLNDTVDNPIIDYDISNVCIMQNEDNKNKYFWKDPSHSEGPENHASGLCSVVEWPKECLVFKCFSKLAYEDYDHNEDEGKFGLEIGEFDNEGTCIESFENTWFETELARDEYIKRNGLYLDSTKIPEYVNDSNYFTDLRNYPTDTIFYIKKVDGGEAEVFRSELWQLVDLEKDFNISISLFINFINKDDETEMLHSPMLKDGTMSPYHADFYSIEKSHHLLPLNLLVAYYFLETNYANSVSFDFEGNDDIEGFYAHIVSFKFETDNSIIATIVDMENCHFDVSWDEIKNSKFDED